MSGYAPPLPIRKLGLLNPIIIDEEKNLIAGLNRLEAVKHFAGWKWNVH